MELRPEHRGMGINGRKFSWGYGPSIPSDQKRRVRKLNKGKKAA